MEEDIKKTNFYLRNSLNSLKIPAFSLLLTAQFFSLTGTWTQGTAQRWLIFEMTNSNFYVGLLGAISGLPFLLFSFLGGWLTDKFPKVNLMFISQCVILAQSIIFGLLVLNKEFLNIPIFLSLAFIFTTAMSIEVPARQALIYEMVGRNLISNALGLHSVVFNLAQVIGPPIAGFLLNMKLSSAPFFFKSLTTIVVLILILRMAKKINTRTYKKENKNQYTTKEVLIIAKSHPLIRTVMIILLIFSFFLTPFWVLMPALCRDVLHLSVREYGIISGAVGAGSFFAGIILTIFSKQTGDESDRKFWWLLGILLYPFTMIFLSMTTGFWDTTLYVFLAGMAGIFTANSSISLLQVNIEDEYRGKILGLFTMSFMGLFPFGSIALGYFANYINIRNTFLISGVFSLIGVILSLRNYYSKLNALGNVKK